MNKLKNISALFLFVMALTFGACSQDETMDDILDNTEINAPSPANDDNGGSGEDTDPPSNDGGGD